MGLYAIPRYLTKNWDKLDWLRVAIPPLALIGWAMLQRATAFDAAVNVLNIDISDATRTVIALLLAVVLAGMATALAYKADQKNPNA
jgi:hypothetical protein